MNSALAVIGLGYGDEGKGATVDRLAAHRQSKLVVRFNGGMQALHHVISPAGNVHGFSQWGSGTFAGARTHLSRFMAIEPRAMVREAVGLVGTHGITNPFELLTVSPKALVVTPYHRAVNQLKEHRRTNRHGSCGLGIGEAVEHSLARPDEAIRAEDLSFPAIVTDKLDAIERWYDGYKFDKTMAVSASHLCDCGAGITLMDDSAAINDTPGTVIFEGAQGVLLDEWEGFYPHTTWSTTTFENAITLCREAGYQGEFTRIGVTRTHHTRHGAGPFPSERELKLTDEHNHKGEWQGAFRTGLFDRVLFRYALAVCGGVDRLAVTHLDSDSAGGSYVEAYEGINDKFYDKQERRLLQLPRSMWKLPGSLTLDRAEALTNALYNVVPRVYGGLTKHALIELMAHDAGVTSVSLGWGAERHCCA